MLSVAVDDKFAMAIDDVIKLSGTYSSRSEFMKDSLRKNIEQTNKFSEDIKRGRESTRKLAALAKSRGFTGRMPTQRERDKVALEYLKENGLI